MKKVLSMVAALLLLSGCDRVSHLFDRKLQCHDEDAQQTTIEILREQASQFATNNGIDPSVVAIFFAHHAPTFSLIVEKSRNESGAIACTASLSLPMTNSTIDAFESPLRTQAATASAFGNFAVARDKVAEIKSVLGGGPSGKEASRASWDIAYDVTLTSDGKQFVVSLNDAKRIASYMSYLAYFESELASAKSPKLVDGAGSEALHDRASSRQSSDPLQACILKKMQEWQVQRDARMDEWCDRVAKEGGECRLTAGQDMRDKEEATEKMSRQCHDEGL